MVLTVLIKEYILHIDVMAARIAETLSAHSGPCKQDLLFEV